MNLFFAALLFTSVHTSHVQPTPTPLGPMIAFCIPQFGPQGLMGQNGTPGTYTHAEVPALTGSSGYAGLSSDVGALQMKNVNEPCPKVLTQQEAKEQNAQANYIIYYPWEIAVLPK